MGLAIMGLLLRKPGSKVPQSRVSGLGLRIAAYVEAYFGVPYLCTLPYVVIILLCGPPKSKPIARSQTFV